MPPEIHIVDDPAAAVGEILADQARRGGSIVLTGGTSPGRAYEHAAERAPDWSRITLWWGDERCVPPDDDRSNYLLARQTLLKRLAVEPRTVHRIEGELAPDEAARRLDAALEGAELDLLLLGMGPDGHVASLFPGSPQLAVTDRRAVSGPPGLEPFVERVTMTMPVLRAARRTVLLITGEQKADAIARALAGDDLPVAHVLPDAVVFLDGPAGSKIRTA